MLIDKPQIKSYKQHKNTDNTKVKTTIKQVGFYINRELKANFELSNLYLYKEQKWEEGWIEASGDFS